MRQIVRVKLNAGEDDFRKAWGGLRKRLRYVKRPPRPNKNSPQGALQTAWGERYAGPSSSVGSVSFRHRSPSVDQNTLVGVGQSVVL
jgi:hypothetical protein